MYSKEIKKYLLASRNSDPNLPYNGFGKWEFTFGCETNPDKLTTAKAEASLYIVNDTIEGVRIKAFGPPIVMAAASWAAEQLRGLHLEDARILLTPQNIGEALGTHPERVKAQGCLVLAAAVYLATYDYLGVPPPKLPPK